MLRGLRVRAGAGVLRVWSLVLPVAVYQDDEMTAGATGAGFRIAGHNGNTA